MTLANTDLHPSHDWKQDRDAYFCLTCLACSCCVGSGATGSCIGYEGREKEARNDQG